MFVHAYYLLTASWIATNGLLSINDTIERPVCNQCKQNVCAADSQCLYGCEDGFYGPYCDYRCNDGCLQNKCKDSDGGPAECSEGCIAGRWGPACQLNCPYHCNQCDRKNGSLCSLCEDFFHGTDCMKNCRRQCPQTGCNRNGTCKILCLPRLMLPNCVHRCGTGCKHCDESTGECKHCHPNYAGTKCHIYCQNCAGTCSKEGCVDGCPKGLYGRECLLRCSPTCGCPSETDYSHDCIGECFQADGSCKHGCINSYYGSKCQHRCSNNCVNRTCNTTIGVCLFGCDTGKFGADCTKDCSETCKGSNCEMITGRCVNGCAVSHYGEFCLSVCDTCLRNRCNSLTGECVYGCRRGYYGSNCLKMCDSKCETGMCYRNTGECVKKDEIMSGGSTTPKETTSENKENTVTLSHIGIAISVLVVTSIITILLVRRFCKSSCLPPLYQHNSVNDYDEINIEELEVEENPNASRSVYASRSLPTSNDETRSRRRPEADTSFHDDAESTISAFVSVGVGHELNTDEEIDIIHGVGYRVSNIKTNTCVTCQDTGKNSMGSNKYISPVHEEEMTVDEKLLSNGVS